MLCTHCINYEKERTDRGFTKHKCAKYPNVCVMGQLQNENIVKNCGEYVNAKEKEK